LDKKLPERILRCIDSAEIQKFPSRIRRDDRDAREDESIIDVIAWSMIQAGDQISMPREHSSDETNAAIAIVDIS